MIEDLLQVTIFSMRDVERWFCDSIVSNTYECMICWTLVLDVSRQSHLQEHLREKNISATVLHSAH